MVIQEKLDIKTVGSLLKEKLAIPDYQRPYKWQEQHVKQLFEDILHHQKDGKKHYRLGTIVVHHDINSKRFNIVDGQQRMITLTLLAVCLEDSNMSTKEYTLLEKKFTSPVSINNIKQNKLIFDRCLSHLNKDENKDKKKIFKDYLLENCELVYVELDDLGEAFQFFDSQNSRGKELAPYDLLKAYHLREMSEAKNTEEEKISCVKRWEEMVSPSNDQDPSLEVIIGDYLFRIRQWSKGLTGRYFTRTQIHIFKGISLQNCNYRYADNMRALNYAVEEYNNDLARKWDRNIMDYSFSTDQIIANGKSFFQYISYYACLYEKLFLNKNSKIKYYLDIVNNESYDGRNRRGDQYVRNLFFCSVLYYYDRFGDSDLEDAARVCFRWSYKLRLNKFSVRLASIDKKGTEEYGLFHVIKNAVHPREVLSVPVESIDETEIKGTKIDVIIEEFKNGKC